MVSQSVTEAGNQDAEGGVRSGGGHRKRSPVRTIFLGVGGRGVLMLVNMLVLVVTSRLLTPAEFGTFAIAQLCVDFANSASYSLVSIPMLQRHKMRNVDYAHTFTLFLILGVIVSGALWAASGAVEVWLDMEGLAPLLRVASLIVFLRFLASFYAAVLQRHLKVSQIVWAQTRSQVFSAIFVTLTLAIFGFGAWALLFGLLASTILEVLTYVRKAGYRPRLVLSREAVRFVSAGVPSFASRMLIFGSDSIDRLFIGRNFEASSLGIYARAASFVHIPENLIGNPAQNALLSWFSRIKSQKDQVAGALAQTLGKQGVLLVPLVIALALASPLFVRLLLGAQWEAAVPLAQVLFIGTIARLGSIPMETASLTLGFAWGAARRQGASALILAAGLIIAIWQPLIWVAYAVALSRLVYYLLGVRFAIITFRLQAEPIVIAHIRGLITGAMGLAASTAVMYFAPAMPKMLADFCWPAVFTSLTVLLLLFGPRWLVGSIGRDVMSLLKARLPFRRAGRE